MNERFEQQEAVPPPIKSTLRGIRALGYDTPEIEQGDLETYQWRCPDCQASGWRPTTTPAIEACPKCAEENLEIGDAITRQVVQVLLQGNPMRHAVAAMAVIPKERTVGQGEYEGLTLVTAEHIAIASAMMEAFTLACMPQALKTGGQN